MRFRLANLFLVTLVAAVLVWFATPQVKQWLKPPIEPKPRSIPRQASPESPFITYVPTTKSEKYVATILDYVERRKRLRESRWARAVPATVEQAIAEEEALTREFGESLTDPDLRRAFMSPEEVRAREIERRHMMRKDLMISELRKHGIDPKPYSGDP
jgi:hypothetical protein